MQTFTVQAITGETYKAFRKSPLDAWTVEHDNGKFSMHGTKADIKREIKGRVEHIEQSGYLDLIFNFRETDHV